MSVRVQTWVWDHSDTNGNDRLVLLALADEADDDGGNAYPSMERLAKKCRVNKATVMRAIRRLEEAREIVVHRPEEYGRGRFNTYVLLMGRNPETVAYCNPSVAAEAQRKTARKGAEGRAQVQPDPLTPRPVDESTLPAVAESDDATRGMVEELCKLLADAIAEHGAAKAKPVVSDGWRRDMSLLLRRGPKGAQPAPIDPERVARCIAVLFSDLAVPSGSGGFCWADQVQSPAALRKYWPRIANAARALRTSGPAARRQQMFDELRREGDAQVVDIGSRGR